MPVDPRLEKLRQKAKNDIFYLANEILDYDFVPEVHGELFDVLGPADSAQPFLELEEIKNKLILWPRGHLKTSAVIAKVVQLILKFPDIRILLFSGTQELTKGILGSVKSHFTTNKKMRKLFPEFCADRLGTTKGFTCPARQNKALRDNTVSITTQGSTKSGTHYDVMFIDDLVNDQNYDSPRKLEKVKQAYLDARPLLNPGGYVILTGTRYLYNDLYAFILEEAERPGSGWKVSVKKCWSEKDGVLTVLFPQFRTSKDLLLGFTVELLKQIQAEDPSKFANQYLNEPLAFGEGLFSKELLTARTLSNFPDGMSSSLIVVDHAPTANDRSDDSVILVGKRTATGQIVVVDHSGGKLPVAELVKEIVRLTVQHRPFCVQLEQSQGAEFLEFGVKHQARTDNIYIPLVIQNSGQAKGAKHSRIKGAALAMHQDRLYVSTDFALAAHKQFVSYPKGAHDDYLDALGLLVEAFDRATTVPMPARLNPFAPQQKQTAKPYSPYTLISRNSNDNTSRGSLGAWFGQ